VCKAGAVSIAWYFFPVWFFVVVACGIYLRSFFQVGRLLWLFLAALILSIGLPTTFWGFFLVGILFFFLFGMKDFIFIDRNQIADVLGILLLFLGVIELSAAVQSAVLRAIPFLFIIPVVGWYILRESILRYKNYHVVAISRSEKRREFLWVIFGALLAGEYGVAVAELPLGVIGLSTLLFAGVSTAFFIVGEGRGKAHISMRSWVWVGVGIFVVVFAIMDWTL